MFFQMIQADAIRLPANQATWATDARRSTNNTQAVTATFSAHAIQSRVITGTITNPAAATTWLSHNANQSTQRIHTSNTRGVDIRAQFRASSNQLRFTSGGSWMP